jgi:hypothetical protein
MVGGRSQQRTSGHLIAFEDRGAAGWMSASAAIAQRTVATRTVVAMPDYLVDELTWSAVDGNFVDLPLHVDVRPVGPPIVGLTGPLEGNDGLEDGFRFVRDPMRIAAVASGETIRLQGVRDAERIDLWIGSDSPFEVWRLTAPGAPGNPDAAFILVRARVKTGVLRAIWNWTGSDRVATLFPNVVVTADSARHEHSRTSDGWNIAISVGDARSTIDLGGQVREQDTSVAPEHGGDDERRVAVLKPERPIRVSLGEKSYRRSEQTWDAAGRPTADIVFENASGDFRIGVSVANVDRSFVAQTTVNPLDNEPADINGAGIQLYVRTDDASAGYLLVPNASDTTVNIRPIDGWGREVPVTATWRELPRGYSVDIRILGLSEGTVVDVDVIVNEKPLTRDRRRGQLVLSGGAGEFVYLRGDRQDSDRLIPMLLTNE